jgi:hypothetical protein
VWAQVTFDTDGDYGNGAAVLSQPQQVEVSRSLLAGKRVKVQEDQKHWHWQQ